jgi:hypothetical protein
MLQVSTGGRSLTADHCLLPDALACFVGASGYRKGM